MEKVITRTVGIVIVTAVMFAGTLVVATDNLHAKHNDNHNQDKGAKIDRDFLCTSTSGDLSTDSQQVTTPKGKEILKCKFD